MIRPLFATAISLGGLCSHLFAADSPETVRQKLLGAWKLLSYIREEVPSGAKSDVMGPMPTGYLHYGSDGRMSVRTLIWERVK